MNRKKVSDDSKLWETYGLNKHWGDAYDLFGKAYQEELLSTLINVFQIRNRVNCLGNLLRFLSSSLTLELLSSWANQQSEITELLNFSNRIISEPSLLQIYHPVPDNQKASNQLRANLNQSYLLALLLTKPGYQSKKDNDWFNTMKLWFIVHAFLRGLKNNYQDDLMRQTSSKLRLAVEKEDVWHQVFKTIQPVDSGFNNINEYIIFSAQKSITRKTFTEQSKIKFLKEIRAVAAGEEKKDSHNISDLIPVEINYTNNQPESETENLSFTDSNTNIWQINDDEELIAEVSFAPNTPIARQRLSLNSVLLRTTSQKLHIPVDWNNLLAHETKCYEQEIQLLSQSELPEEKLLGLFIWAALNTGRTLSRVCDMTIKPQPDKEWSMHPSGQFLHRLPPHRKSDWAPKNDDQQALLKPYAESINLSLPSNLSSIISNELRRHAGCETLGCLWTKSTPESFFTENLSNKLPNISSSQLSNHLSAVYFKDTEDESIAELVSSHPQSALSADTAYCNWTTGDQQRSTKNLIVFEYQSNTQTNDEVILFGASLDPAERLLSEEINKWNQNYEACSEAASVIEKHNLFTANIVTMLFAATGARPVIDPFESILHFDFENHLLFIDDKAVGSENNGRLVPVPKVLSDYIKTKYLQHLSLLSKHISDSSPQLSKDILSIVQRLPSSNIPAFFFLELNDSLEWVSISEVTIKKLKVFDSPLPSNLFRHRLAKDLRRKGVHPEIVAGILGHSEVGLEPYGIYSHRNLSNDFYAARDAIELSFSALPFKFFELQTLRIVDTQLKKTTTQVVDNERPQFGAVAREARRRKSRLQTIRMAASEINQFLLKKGKALHNLSGEEIEEVSKQMLFYPEGLKRTNGFIRYELLVKRLEKEGEKHNQIQLNKRQVSFRAASVFSPYATSAKTIYSKSKLECLELLKKAQPSKLPITNIVAYIPVLLAIESRFVNFKVIKQIIEEKKFNICALNNHYYLNILLDTYSGYASPATRIRISKACALLLTKLLASKRKQTLSIKTPVQLLPVIKPLSFIADNVDLSNFEESLKLFLSVVDQYNWVTLSGIEAGFLSGKVESYSLSLFDWTKLRTGKHLQFPSTEEANELDDALKHLAIPNNHLNQFEIKDAYEFYRLIRKCFRHYQDELIQRQDQIRRSQLIMEINKLIKDFSSRISNTLLLLASWSVYLLENKHSKKRKLRVSSVLSYFETLSSYLRDLGFNQNLLLLNDEEITTFYVEIIDACSPARRAYLGRRLIEFDRYTTMLGVESPDWSELAIEQLSTKVSPGIILEREYQDALKHLSLLEDNTFKQELLAVLLLICYRFGLRSQEALGLMFSDFYIDGEALWIYVQNNKYRKLKNKGSRRKVPLLFPLEAIEKELLTKHFAMLEAEFGLNKKVPFFHHNLISLSKSQKKQLTLTVNKVLKIVTNNQETSLHHCRHTFASRLFLRTVNKEITGWQTIDTPNANTSLQLVGHTGQNKRISWATARALGHSIRDTQFRSYNHSLSDLCEEHFAQLKFNVSNPLEDYYLKIDGLPKKTHVDYSLIENLSPRQEPLTLLKIIKVFRLVNIGKAIDDACLLLNVNDIDRDKIKSTLRKQLKHVTVDNNKVNELEFIRAIKPASWSRLMSYTSQQSVNIDQTIENIHTERRSKLKINETVIGPTRQILLWKKAHFRLFKHFLDVLQVEQNSIKTVISNSAKKNIHRFLSLTKLNYTHQKVQSKKQNYQLDAIEENGLQVKSRAGVISVKNSQSLAVRNTYDLTILFVSFLILIDD